mmetsp:Transcript_122831/g.333565  ORF Transcript_122831/g.333565 Transcript_122831/m.333565 type:complete len:209 (+) Transcript_122831:1042-1668(+)
MKLRGPTKLPRLAAERCSAWRPAAQAGRRPAETAGSASAGPPPHAAPAERTAAAFGAASSPPSAPSALGRARARTCSRPCRRAPARGSSCGRWPSRRGRRCCLAHSRRCYSRWCCWRCRFSARLAAAVRTRPRPAAQLCAAGTPEEHGPPRPRQVLLQPSPPRHGARRPAFAARRCREGGGPATGPGASRDRAPSRTRRGRTPTGRGA